jgi:hypothetical protein
MHAGVVLHLQYTVCDWREQLFCCSAQLEAMKAKTQNAAG